MKNNRHIIAHLLSWRLSDITSKLDQIKEAGFDTILVSPLQGCKDDNNHGFWIYYQPLSMSLVGSKQIGYREDLINLCKEAEKRNIIISVDLVFRHSAGG
jgi:glycosidase